MIKGGKGKKRGWFILIVSKKTTSKPVPPFPGCVGYTGCAICGPVPRGRHIEGQQLGWVGRVARLHAVSMPHVVVAVIGGVVGVHPVIFGYYLYREVVGCWFGL